MEEWERLIDELRAEILLRERELELLHEIDLRLLESDYSTNELFSFIVSRTQKLLQADHTTILLRRSTFLEPIYSNVTSVVGQRVPISESLVGLCLEMGQSINVADLTNNPRGNRYTPLRGYQGPPMRSLLATPIIIREAVVGVLNSESKNANHFRPVHRRISAALAVEVGIALQRAQLLQSSALFADVDRLMFADVDRLMLAGDDSPHVVQTALEQVMDELRRLEHIQHSGAQIMFRRGEDELEIVHSTNRRDIGLIIDIEGSISGRAVRERKTVIVGDVASDPGYRRMLGESIQSQIAVPILFGDDDIVIGVLSVESAEANAFHGFYQVVLEGFAEKVRTLLAFAKLRADLTEALELRSANDLLLAVGDQTSHLLHRLNNTVGAMRFRIRELQDMQASGELTKDFLDESLESLRGLADRTLQMPGEITHLLSLEGGTVDVNEIVRKTLEQINLPEGVRLELSLDNEIPPIPLYSFDIVVQNLLKNALDAMPEGGKLSVVTSMVLPAPLVTGYFQLIVQDTGVGIPVDVLKKVFELNFTTKRERGKGLGLGLWWVRNFVRRSRGDITIQSMVGRGTEVTVKIPIDRSGENR